MRILLTTATIALMAASAACGGDSKPASTPTATSAPAVASATSKTPVPATTATGATPAASTPATSKTAVATAAGAQTQTGDVVDVTGIVGTLNLNGNVIEIKRLQGAAVTQIAVDSTTVIRKATGGRVLLKDIRTSDRIIAKGKLNDRRDQLIATEITVQDVVPGAQPGG